MACGCNPFNCSQTVCCQCGEFATPVVADEGACAVYRQKISCEAPTAPVAPCPAELYYTIYQPQNVASPFAVSATLMDENCVPITDQNHNPITLILV